MDEAGRDKLGLLTNILARVAHDTVGPLTAARVALSCGETDEAEQAVAEVVERLDALGRLRAPVRGWFDLRHEIEQVRAFVTAKPAWKGIHFEIRCDESQWWCDPALVRHAIHELVRNAAIACSRAACVRAVTIMAEGRDDSIRIAVEQTAPMPSVDDVARLLAPAFSSLWRASGFGLGLPVVLAIAAAHGGRVTTEDNAFVLVAPREFDVRRVR